jgi:hypothetical protein
LVFKNILKWRREGDWRDDAESKIAHETTDALTLLPVMPVRLRAASRGTLKEIFLKEGEGRDGGISDPMAGTARLLFE